ncbi:hypothetical protein [Bradyrhizobium sp. 87]|uniref:hypothetical protein n=1 Tax=Bradyrhizobium sp. 87 TaxID=2782682 RepID=UPI001FFB0F55|nr:hypothetical protein [Bradyrhizobium sp. 87]MCK1430866.1 hypothetical protein [Bradyrhizobium sp. 87]
MPELVDEIRVPLHELQADVDYLIGRVIADASCASTIAASIKGKLTAIEAAILSGAPAQPSAMADDLDRLAFRLRQSADHDGPQELKMVMRRVATALDRTSQPSPAALVQDCLNRCYREITRLSGALDCGRANKQLDAVEAAEAAHRSAGNGEPPLSVQDVQQEFYVWWADNQEDPAHGMITQNCALATWKGAYDKYVRNTKHTPDVPPRNMTKWPDTLGFDDRDKYIDELEAQIERLRAVPQQVKVPDGYAKLPAGMICKCFKMWRDENGNHWCCTPPVTRPAPQTLPTREDIARIVCCSGGCILSDTEDGCIACHPAFPEFMTKADAILALSRPHGN